MREAGLDLSHDAALARAAGRPGNGGGILRQSGDAFLSQVDRPASHGTRRCVVELGVPQRFLLPKYPPRVLVEHKLVQITAELSREPARSSVGSVGSCAVCAGLECVRLDPRGDSAFEEAKLERLLRIVAQQAIMPVC